MTFPVNITTKTLQQKTIIKTSRRSHQCRSTCRSSNGAGSSGSSNTERSGSGGSQIAAEEDEVAVAVGVTAAEAVTTQVLRDQKF